MSLDRYAVIFVLLFPLFIFMCIVCMMLPTKCFLLHW